MYVCSPCFFSPLRTCRVHSVRVRNWSRLHNRDFIASVSFIIPFVLTTLPSSNHHRSIAVKYVLYIDISCNGNEKRRCALSINIIINFTSTLRVIYSVLLFILFFFWLQAQVFACFRTFSFALKVFRIVILRLKRKSRSLNVSEKRNFT